MLNKLGITAIGTTSVASLEAVQSIDIPTSVEIENTVKLVLQIIVTIATLVGLFKKKRSTN
jgi:GrpB-like predicted nucleotidyltransferase (UPF0157 family)